ncbi:unnamed protein product [Cylindrotheca closterium]|uniref:Kinesin light chain n=1 Tax=Cylindrotheca closterium TaxID=2856 RepID=A0AAD2G2E1_9STRA|nr:unnamed protein product [Cylindrotheca closterium]CAJ1960270.1 unnamed protein product [Cylindrotheca closterium]
MKPWRNSTKHFELAIRLEKLGEKHVDTANVYMSKRQLLPNDHSDVTVLYHHLSYSLERQGKFSEATKMHKLQLAPLLEMHGEDHPEVVRVYTGIAELLRLQNRLADSLQMLDRAMEICNRFERLGNLDRDILLVTLGHRSLTLKGLGNLEAATEALNKSANDTDGNVR